MLKNQNSLLSAVVIVAALGYFVDVFDLILFAMVRIQSLKDLGITNPQEIESIGRTLDNYQMFGMLLGGFLWGIIGDKKGRMSVLFGSIIVYSLANILNAYVQDITTYSILRFIAGFGLAGELGAGVTLATESLSKEKRGKATAIIAGFGAFGACFGGIIVHLMDWRTAYLVGGIMGMLLLFLRINVHESSIFKKAKKEKENLGSLKLIFGSKKSIVKYFSVIAIAIPIWYLIQLYAKFAPELCDAVGLNLENSQRGNVARISMIAIYFGLSTGDVASGFISNFFKSRTKTVLTFFVMMMIFLVGFWTIGTSSVILIYVFVGLLGFSAGYWAIFMTIAAESFGTNIRSTVTNTAPNMVRGSVILINIAYEFFKEKLRSPINANFLVGFFVLIFAFWGFSKIKDSYHNSMDFNEK